MILLKNLILRFEKMKNEGEKKKAQKSDWWSENSYSESIFKMTMEEYVETIPNPDLWSAISGCLGRWAWGEAEEMIWERMRESDAETVNDIRLDLLARQYETKNLSTEDQARLAKVTEKIQHLIPRVTAEDFEVLEQILEDVQRIADINSGSTEESVRD